MLLSGCIKDNGDLNTHLMFGIKLLLHKNNYGKKEKKFKCNFFYKWT